ncbi:coiled-coil domain-containing protein 112 [Fopius arisanus]|uniref:Coiled-coil domain-containing protein 112 n=1 Tax=Fopius arisanus TaxID=64838 RepID=A0A9R1TE13_9HYME|nr:PREDICTED: coiled-coil domain-containing protein 112-like [Fopius arisanus]
MSQAEKKKFIRTLIKLKQQEEFLAKSVETFEMGMKVEANVIEDFSQTRKQSSIDRTSMTDAIYRLGSIIYNDFQTAKLMVGQVYEGNKIDPEELKSKLLCLSKKVKEFNSTSQLEILLDEQKELEEALLDFRMNIRQYEKPYSGMETPLSRRIPRNTKRLETIDYDEIADFDSLVVKTGHTQHWKQQDHLFFLKIRKKAQNVPAMVVAIRNKCPDLTAEEIINHEAWYKIYVDLREKQRNTVKEWRKNKELEKREKTRLLKNYNESSDKKSHHEANVNDSKINESSTSSDEKRKLISKLKTEKENSRLKNQSEDIRSWNERQFLQRNMEIKAALDEYTNKRMQGKLGGEQSKNKNDKIVKNPAMRKSFRERDSNYLSKRKIFNLKNEKDDKVEINMATARSRSNSTLLKPTKIWEERCRQKLTPGVIPKAVCYIKNLPRLSTCNWKNQESIISL